MINLHKNPHLQSSVLAGVAAVVPLTVFAVVAGACVEVCADVEPLTVVEGIALDAPVVDEVVCSAAGSSACVSAEKSHKSFRILKNFLNVHLQTTNNTNPMKIIALLAILTDYYRLISSKSTCDLFIK